MSRIPPMSYAEALRIVARDDQRMNKLNQILGHMLFVAAPFTALASLGLVDPKNEAVVLLREMTGTAAGRIKSTEGKPHLELLEAAHTVIGLSAFFDAFAQVAGIEVTDDDKQRIAGRASGGPFPRELQTGSLPMPTPTCGFEDNLVQIEAAFHRLMTSMVAFLDGLEAWEQVRPGDTSELSGQVVAKAREIYKERFVRFAVDIPEFGFWIQLDAASAASRQVTELASAVGDSLAGLQIRLNALGGVPGAITDVERKLARRAQEILDQPIWRNPTPGLAFPSVREGFVSPRYRLAAMTKESEPASEDWWDDIPSADDLATFLADHLAAPNSARQPLIILGHPGAGKTLLTEVVAARIPAEKFTTVLVKLRRVDANADPHRQIEAALESSTRESSLSWGTLCRESKKTKVVIFDGLDELIQATGTTQSDYIERVTDFQRDEWRDGNAVITVITSRHLVMDRVRVPEGTTMIRLEDFSEEQVRGWADTWNLANAHSPGFTPLAAETVLDKAELGRQPLLLFLLAIYAAGNSGRALDDPTLQGADLYGALLDSFITRQVHGKATTELSPEEQRKRENALRQDLSIAAFAMFNRGRQFVTEEELSHDLSFLAPEEASSRTAGYAEPLTRAKSTVAAFFFIHVGRAQEHEDSSLRSYEFLHATFGEYLVAEYVTRQLGYLASDWRSHNERGNLESLNDDLLFALLSHRCLTTRRPVVEFAQRLVGRTAGDAVSSVIAYLFNRARKPRIRGDIARCASGDVVNGLANYTANLAVLLLVASRGRQAITSFTTAEYWASTVRLWQAGLAEDGQQSVAGSVEIEGDLVEIVPGTVPRHLADAAFARLAQDNATELRATTGETFWGDTQPADENELKFYSAITELQASRWPVPPLAKMTLYDERAYENLLEKGRLIRNEIDSRAIHHLLTLLIDDGPFLSPDLTRALVVFSLGAVPIIRGRIMVSLADRCPFLLEDQEFHDRLKKPDDVPDALDFIMYQNLSDRDKAFWPPPKFPKSIGPMATLLATPEMVAGFARTTAGNIFRRDLVDALRHFGDLAWSRISPEDLIALLDAPSPERTVQTAVDDYLRHQRSIGTSEEVLARLIPFSSER